MDFWQIYSIAPIEVKVIFYLLIGLILTTLILIVVRKGIQFKNFKFGGKDRYLTAKETIQAMQESFGIVEERSEIKNILRINDQLAYADQENIHIQEMLIDRFVETLEKTIGKPSTKHKSVKNYALVVETLLKEIVHENKKYFKGFQYKDGENELKKELENPKSELCEKIDKRIRWTMAKIVEILHKRYNEEDIIPIQTLLEENDKIAKNMETIVSDILSHGFIVHSQYNDRIKELNSKLDKYTTKLSS